MGWQDAPEIQGWQDAPEVDETGRPLTQSEKVAKGGLWNLLAGPELFLSALSNAAVEPVAGLAGIGASILPGGMTGPEAVEAVRGRAYQPQTELAQGAQNLMANTIGKYGEATDWAGEKAAEITGSPAVGAGVKTALDIAPAAIPAGRNAVRNRSLRTAPDPVSRARQAGYTLDPTQVVGGQNVGGPWRAGAQAVGGKARIPAQASLKNQQVTNRLVAEEIGAPNPKLITKADIANLRQKANNSYTKIKANTTKMRVQADQQLTQSLDDAVTQAADPLTGTVNKAVVKELRAIQNLQGEQTISAVLSKVEKLRRDARVNFKADDPARVDLARAQRAAADALEDAVGRTLQRGAPDLLPEYQAARQQLAKLHNVEDAWVNGNIDAVKLARLREQGAPLTGNLEIVADVADYFPRVMQSRANVGNVSRLGNLDAVLAFPTAGTWPAAKILAQEVAPVPPYRPVPPVNSLLQTELLGSQMSAYNDGNN